MVSVQDGSEFTSSQADQVNQILYIMYALLALTIIIAVLGIINTMALSVFERTREIGLLRAVGLSRRQLRRMITLESVQTSVFGAVLGAVLGIAVGIVVQRGLVSQGLEELAIPWIQIVDGRRRRGDRRCRGRDPARLAGGAARRPQGDLHGVAAPAAGDPNG